MPSLVPALDDVVVQLPSGGWVDHANVSGQNRSSCGCAGETPSRPSLQSMLIHVAEYQSAISATIPAWSMSSMVWRDVGVATISLTSPRNRFPPRLCSSPRQHLPTPACRLRRGRSYFSRSARPGLLDMWQDALDPRDRHLPCGTRSPSSQSGRLLDKKLPFNRTHQWSTGWTF